MDADEGRQTLELHNVILKESLRHNIFIIQLARRQGLECEISNVQGAKIRLVNRLQDGSTKLFALMTEEAGRWTLDTSVQQQTPMTTSVLHQVDVEATSIKPEHRVTTFGQFSVDGRFRTTLGSLFLSMCHPRLRHAVCHSPLPISEGPHISDVGKRLQTGKDSCVRPAVTSLTKRRLVPCTYPRTGGCLEISNGQHQPTNGALVATGLIPSSLSKLHKVDEGILVMVQMAAAEVQCCPTAAREVRRVRSKGVVHLSKCISAIMSATSMKGVKVGESSLLPILSFCTTPLSRWSAPCGEIATVEVPV